MYNILAPCFIGTLRTTTLQCCLRVSSMLLQYFKQCKSKFTEYIQYRYQTVAPTALFQYSLWQNTVCWSEIRDHGNCFVDLHSVILYWAVLSRNSQNFHANQDNVTACLPQASWSLVCPLIVGLFMQIPGIVIASFSGYLSFSVVWARVGQPPVLLLKAWTVIT